MYRHLESLPDVLRVSELAEFLQVSTITLKRWDNENWFPIKPSRINPRGDRRYLKSDLIEFLNK